jgi:hypothetical protein
MATVEADLKVGPYNAAECQRALAALEAFGQVLSIKSYRVPLDPPAVPLIPCLDHEAMLHQRTAPHVAAYIQERGAGDLHEVVFVPDEQRISVDTVSTFGECSAASHERLLAWLASEFPRYRVGVSLPSWLHADRRIAEACRAQLSLREVLLAPDIEGVRRAIERLQTIAMLMEKQSRVASWGVRTVTGPLLPAAAIVAFFLLGTLTERLGQAGVRVLAYVLVTGIGGVLIYYGLKAVQLTEIANRVWKRAAEYSLILGERRRLNT